MSSGALLFGRYAFPPNRLGYCGSGDHQALFEYVSQQQTDRGLIELEQKFEGAYPYLKLIALANEIPDPFDRRVVEAYWIGNRYLEQVDAASFYASLEERFKREMGARSFSWLTGKLVAGAKPHHVFHVFDIYMRTGLLRDARASIVLSSMDACRISWGKVAAVDGPELVVERPALTLQAGKLALADPTPKRVLRQIEGRGFADSAEPGDYVSIHWDWVCDVLSSSALQRLTRATRRYMALANETL